MKDYTEYLDVIPEDVWTEIPINIYVFKKQNGGIAVIHPNVSHFSEVSEWQSLCYRLINNVRIDGITFKNSDLLKIKRDLEKELNFLSTISVPERIKGAIQE